MSIITKIPLYKTDPLAKMKEESLKELIFRYNDLINKQLDFYIKYGCDTDQLKEIREEVNHIKEMTKIIFEECKQEINPEVEKVINSNSINEY